jgi:hypothetical protein
MPVTLPPTMRLAAAALLMGLAPMSTAAAQGVGGLIRGAREKAEAAAKKAETEKKTDESSDQLVIDRANVDMFIDVMRQTVVRADEVQAFKKVEDAHKAKVQEREDCRTKVFAGGLDATSEAALLEGERYNDMILGVQERMIAANMAGDTLRARILGDSIEVLNDLALAASMPGLKNCGAELAMPVQGPFKSASPKLPGKVSTRQYGVLRERIGAWLMDGADGPRKTSASLTYTSSELAELKARMPELSQFVEYFRSGAIAWAGWADVSIWQ